MEGPNELNLRRSFDDLRLTEPPLGFHAGDIIFVGKRQHARRRRQRRIAAALVIAASVVPVGVTWLPATGDVLHPVTPSTPYAAISAPSVARPIAPVRVSASSTAQDSTDTVGNTVTFAPENAVDGMNQTAWRPIEGDGVGQTFTLDLGGTYTVTTVGLLPGYAKTDAVTGRSRFLQNRRIEEVRWIFDDGSSVTQHFTDDPTLQRVDVSAVTSSVAFEIIATRDPDVLDQRNYAPVSEIEVWGAL